MPTILDLPIEQQMQLAEAQGIGFTEWRAQKRELLEKMSAFSCKLDEIRAIELSEEEKEKLEIIFQRMQEEQNGVSFYSPFD